MQPDWGDALNDPRFARACVNHWALKAILSPAVMRVIIIAGTLYLFANFPMVLLLTLWIAVVWLVPRVFRDHPKLTQPEPEPDPVAEAVAEFLQVQLNEAEEKIVQLESELEASKRFAEADASERGEARSHPVFRRVGLDKDCPRWIVELVRREYRKRLHPDAKPPHQKGEATRRFQEMERTFGEIWEMRGF
jgi:hypothetical protein